MLMMMRTGIELIALGKLRPGVGSSRRKSRQSERGWRGLKLYSDTDGSFSRDYHGIGKNGGDDAAFNVFTRRHGTIRHFWAGEMGVTTPTRARIRAARPTLLRRLFLLQAGQDLLRVRMGVVQRRGLHSMLGLGQRSMQSGLGGGIALGIDDGTLTHAFARIPGLGIETLARRSDQTVDDVVQMRMHQLQIRGAQRHAGVRAGGSGLLRCRTARIRRQCAHGHRDRQQDYRQATSEVLCHDTTPECRGMRRPAQYRSAVRANPYITA